LTFDAFGRTIAQRYPKTEPKSSEGVNARFNAVPDDVTPTTMVYDVLDRNTKTTIPDGTFHHHCYGFGPDRQRPCPVRGGRGKRSWSTPTSTPV